MKRTEFLYIVIPLILVGCSSINTGSYYAVKDMVSGEDDNNSEGGKHTAMQTAAVGTVAGAGIGYAFGEARIGAAVGLFSGQLIGQRLAQMQKDYRGKELELLMKIESIHEEEKALIAKNELLNIKIEELDSKIKFLEDKESLGSSQKVSLYTKINQQIDKKKKSLNALLEQNAQMKKKIAKSESKIYQFNYKTKDKRTLQKDLKTMKRESMRVRENINKKIRELDKLKRRIA